MEVEKVIAEENVQLFKTVCDAYEVDYLLVTALLRTTVTAMEAEEKGK